MSERVHPQSITVTYHRSYNYGASLQAYALQKTLIAVGFQNAILDFYRNPYEKLPLLCGSLRLCIARLASRFYGFLHRKERRTLIEGFDRFTSNKLILTHQYLSLKELIENPPVADCFFAGSDQVFTLREPEFVVKRNFLEFVNDRGKKYSYAASIADYDLSSDEKAQYISYLDSFDTISVREKKAADLLSSLCQRNIRVDVDPVFFLKKEDWEAIVEKPEFPSPYILYFQVNSNAYSNSVLKWMKKKYHLPVVCIQTNPHVSVDADKVILSASPEAFLGWIHDAEVVVTTSFHGTAFSLIFEREFFTLIKEGSNPTRIINLLHSFDLEKRMITGESELKGEYASINWDLVREKMSTYSSESREYLRRVFNQF